MAIWCYCRVSTGEQEKRGHSLPAQTEDCLAFAAQLDDELGTASNCDEPGVFVDASSAYKLPLHERPGGQLLIGHLRPGDTIVMYAVDRGWRNVTDAMKYLGRFIENNIGLRFTTFPGLDLGTANGRVVFACMAAFSEWGSAIKAERCREGRALRELYGKDYVSAKQSSRSRRSVRTRESMAIAAVINKVSSEAESATCGRVFGYVRVSTLDQKVDSQIGPVQKSIDRIVSDGHVDGGIIRDEGVSAFKTQFAGRPGAKYLLEELRRDDHIVILRPDRTFRSVRDMVESLCLLQDRGVVIHLAESGMRSDQPEFQIQLQIMVMMAEMESREISRRTKRALQWLRDNGFIAMNSKKLPPWVKAVSVGDRYRRIEPDLEWIGWAEFAVDLMDKGHSIRKTEVLVEEVMAKEEMRDPTPPSGFSPSIAMKRARKRGDTPEHWARRQKFLEQVQEAKRRKRLVIPWFSKTSVERARKDLAQYYEYLRLMKEDDPKNFVKAIEFCGSSGASSQD